MNKSKLTPNQMLHIVETELDAFQLSNDFKRISKIRQKRLLRALGLVRRLQYNHHPQTDYSLYRFLACDYKRKNGVVLPEKTESKQLDWRRYRRLKELEKYDLNNFMDV